MAAPARHAVDEKTTHSWQEKSTSGTGETHIRWVKRLRAMDPTMGMMALSRLVVPRRAAQPMDGELVGAHPTDVRVAGGTTRSGCWGSRNGAPSASSFVARP
jgi:hypothetical protein